MPEDLKLDAGGKRGGKENMVQRKIWEINLEALEMEQIQMGRKKNDSKIIPRLEGPLGL